MSSKQSRRHMEAALAIPELLESILIHLDMTTLLVSAQRVSKAWKALIDASPAVQQALFFKPVAAESSQDSSGDVEKASATGQQDDKEAKTNIKSSRPVINPLLAKKFNKCFFDRGQTYSLHRRANSFYELPWSRRPVQTTQEIWGGWSQVRPAELSAEEKLEEGQLRRRFTRRGASWRRMLVSQPPPPSLGYMKFDISDLPPEGQKVASASLKPGSDSPFVELRMGDLYDIVQHNAGHHGRHTLWFRVLWGKPTSPFAITRVKETFEKLMEETHVVVEFMHADDNSLPNHPKDPVSESAFDAAFKCDEHRNLEFEPKEVLAYPSEFPNFDGRFVVWHWRLLDHERVPRQ